METDELLHYGIKGQKWGIRRFQNEDRTWTEAGKERYGSGKSDHKESYGSSKQSRSFDKEKVKTVAKVAIAAATVAGAAYLYSQNKGEIDKLVHTMGTKFPSEIENKSSAGEAFLKKTFEDANKALPSTKAAAKAEARATKQFVKKAARNFEPSASEKARDAVTGVAKKVSNTAKSTAKSVGSVASKARSRISSLKPQKKTGWAKIKSDAQKKLATAVIGTVVGKAANKYVDSKLYGDQRLAEKREQNRHEEEMYRIKRNNRRRR